MNYHMNLLRSPLSWYLGHCIDNGTVLQLPASCMEAHTHTHTHAACLETSSNYLQFSVTMQHKLFRTSFEESFSACPSHWGKIVIIWFFFGKLWGEGGEEGSGRYLWVYPFPQFFLMYWRCISEVTEAVWGWRNGPKWRNYRFSSYAFRFGLVFFSSCLITCHMNSGL